MVHQRLVLRVGRNMPCACWVTGHEELEGEANRLPTPPGERARQWALNGIDSPARPAPPPEATNRLARVASQWPRVSRAAFFSHFVQQCTALGACMQHVTA